MTDLLLTEDHDEEADENEDEDEEEGEEEAGDEEHPPMSPSIGRESQDKPPAAVVDFGECSDDVEFC